MIPIDFHCINTTVTLGSISERLYAFNVSLRNSPIFTHTKRINLFMQEQDIFEVREEYQTNPLSHQPGGYTIELVHEIRLNGGGSKLESKPHERVKIPFKYIEKVFKANTADKVLYEAYVEGDLKYRKGDPNSKYKF